MTDILKIIKIIDHAIVTENAAVLDKFAEAMTAAFLSFEEPETPGYAQGPLQNFYYDFSFLKNQMALTQSYEHRIEYLEKQNAAILKWFRENSPHSGKYYDSHEVRNLMSDGLTKLNSQGIY